jgi:tetratricopeptide (TPR) repeat protein
MKLCISSSWLLAGCLVAATGLGAQQQPAGGSGQSDPNKPADTQQKPAQKPAQPDANAFPEDTTSVPVLPNGNSAAAPEELPPDAEHVPLPARDTDPARSPDEPEAGVPGASGSESSSSVTDMDKLIPGADEDSKRKGRKEAPDYHETATNDIDVGKYYIERKDWRAALSRFQSAMVLAPENPDVYWGLAESERHLGDFASARKDYLLVMEYDPDSRRSKEAEKALKEPDIANAQGPAKSQAQPQK